MIRHYSPIIHSDIAGSAEMEEQAGWSIALSFENEAGFQVGLADLCHRPKALAHGSTLQGLGLGTPGTALWNGYAWIGCAKPAEAVVFDMNGPIEYKWEDKHFTDMTDGWALLAILGDRAPDLMARFVALDVECAYVNGPSFLITRCQAIRLMILNSKGSFPGYLIACDRSQGQNLYNACLSAHEELDVRPVGDRVFRKWLESTLKQIR